MAPSDADVAAYTRHSYAEVVAVNAARSRKRAVPETKNATRRWRFC